MRIVEILLGIVLLAVSVFTCVVTLDMDKGDSHSLGVINGIHQNMRKNISSGKKAMANKVVAICTAFVLCVCAGMMVLSEVGVFV